MKKYTTLCPHCNTRFRVVPDHIRISNGLVRCGHCREVFDARPSLTEWHSATPTAQAAASSTVALELPKLPAANTPLSAPAAPPVTLLPVFPAREIADLAQAPLPPQWAVAPASIAPEAQAPTSMATNSDAADTAPLPLEAPQAAILSAERQDTGARVSVGAAVATTADPAAPAVPVAAPPNDHSDEGAPAHPPSDAVPVPEVSFVRQAKREAFWRQPWVRLLLSLLSLGLLLGWVAQLAVHERDRIVAMKPELRPWIEQLCQPIGCEIHVLKQIQVVQIDSSALIDLKNGAYRFEVTLVNTAAYPVALPAVELAITNGDGQTVASKVVLPKDWPESPVQLPPRTEQALQIHMTLDKPQEWPMSGYRALVFYP